MTVRAMGNVHWPGMQNDFARKRAACTSRNKRVPNQPAAELVYSDYLTQHGRKFPIIFDRHLAWSSVHDVGMKEGAQGLISALKTNHTTFGISVEIASDKPATSMAMNPATSLATNPATSMATNPATSVAMNPATSLYGRKFLIIIDRNPAWLSVYDVREKEGAQGLIPALKTNFTTFSISMEIASDEGPRYTASATIGFLTDWDVKHRLPSAYPPHFN